MEDSWALLSVVAYQHAKALALHSRGPGAFPKDLTYQASKGGPNSWTGWLGHPGKQLPVKGVHSNIIQNLLVNNTQD